MPAYLIHHPGGQHGDILVEDDHLTLTFSGNWAIFSDIGGPTLAIPAEQSASIQRVDEPQDHGPAPQPEEK
jgi:hypothetical protein